VRYDCSTFAKIADRPTSPSGRAAARNYRTERFCRCFYGRARLAALLPYAQRHNVVIRRRYDAAQLASWQSARRIANQPSSMSALEVWTPDRAAVSDSLYITQRCSRRWIDCIPGRLDDSDAWLLGLVAEERSPKVVGKFPSPDRVTTPRLSSSYLLAVRKGRLSGCRYSRERRDGVMMASIW